MYKKYLFHICLGFLLCFVILFCIVLADNNSKCYVVLYNNTKSNINNIKIHYSQEVVPIEVPEIKAKEQYSVTISLPSQLSNNKLILAYCDANDTEHECEFDSNDKERKYITINSIDDGDITINRVEK